MRGVFRFHHHPHHRFGAGRAQYHAAAIAQLLFDFGQRGGGSLLPVLPFGKGDIEHRLRIGLPIDGARQRLAEFLQRRQHLQRGDGSVAGIVFVQAQDVAGGFAAHLPAALVKLLEHIAVAHFGAGELDAFALERGFHRQITHHGADHAAQRGAGAGTGFGDDINQLVAVVNRAVFIDHNQAVAVAVERDTVVGFVLQHGSLQGFDVGGADALVDIEAVGGIADADHIGAQLVKDFGRGVVAGAVGGINHQFQIAQIERAGEGGFAKFDVAGVGAVDAAGAAELLGWLGEHLFFQFGFDGQLGGVVQLHAAFGEKLDAVVGKLIMRGGNHHAAGQAQGAGEIGDARGGQRAGLENIDAGGGEAGHQRGFEHIAGNARVFADNHGGFVLAVVLNQRVAESAAEPHHKIGRNRITADPAADAVGAEIFAFFHVSPVMAR